MAEDKHQDEKFCNNCKKDIAFVNFIMHEMHCKRHIVLCKKCNEPVPKSEEEEHFNMYHIAVNCDLCQTKVEKDKLENHKVSDCRSKPVNCAYCELEMPHCDLLHHEGYCGTRTEPCVSCNQYIMIKDFTRHLDSGCQYPIPKPQVTPGGAINMSEVYSQDMGPFTFDEIHRMLDEATVPSLTSLPSEQTNQEPPPRSEFHTPPRSLYHRDRVRNNTSDRSGKNMTNRKSEVNKQKELSSSSPNTQNDNMLSQMFSASQDSNDDITQYMEAFRKQKEIPVLSGSDSCGNGSNINRFNDDEILPCEFCGELFPPDIIIQHQSGCDLASGEWSDSNSMKERNNEVQPEVHRSTAFIPVINNLDTNRQQWQSSNIEVDAVIDNDELYDDEVFLPCEFCTELFPADMLVIHQSICDENTTVTPRVMTPVSTYRPKLKTQNKPFNYASCLTDDPFTTSWSSRRHGAASNLEHEETMQNNNKISELFSGYDQREIVNNRHLTTANNNSSSLNKRSNGEPNMRKSSRQTKNSSRPQDTLNSLLQDDLDMPVRESSTNVERRKLVEAAGNTAERKKKVPISAKKVVEELERNDRESTRHTSNKRSSTTMRTAGNYNDASSTPSSTRQRSTHLLNADSRSHTSQYPPKPSTKPKKQPRR